MRARYGILPPVRFTERRGVGWGVACLVAVLALSANRGHAGEEMQPGPFAKIVIIDCEGMIDGLLRKYVERKLDDAESSGADCIVLRVNSFGGGVGAAREITQRLQEVPDDIHTIAWVHDKAISAAAWISLACREIIVGPAASFGDCQPIVGGAGTPTPVGEKIESPLRAWFRALAEENGYPVLLSEAMVSASLSVIRVRNEDTGEEFLVRGDTFDEADDGDEIVDGHRREDLVRVGSPIVTDKQLLTLTAKEMIDFGFMKREYPDVFPTDDDAMLTPLKGVDAEVVDIGLSFSERALRWLLGFAGILSAIVLLSVLLLFFMGPGIMTIVGGVALALLGAIHMSAGASQGFPLFLILVGLLLLAAEFFVFPGFGIPGALGIACIGAGFMFMQARSQTGDSTTRSVSTDVWQSFAAQFIVTSIAGFVTLMLLSRVFPSVGPGKRMVLATPTDSETGHATGLRSRPAPDVAMGATGIALSDLRPVGSARIGKHDIDVVSETGYIERNDPIRVVAVRGTEIVVESAKESNT